MFLKIQEKSRKIKEQTAKFVENRGKQIEIESLISYLIVSYLTLKP